MLYRLNGLYYEPLSNEDTAVIQDALNLLFIATEKRVAPPVRDWIESVKDLEDARQYLKKIDRLLDQFQLTAFEEPELPEIVKNLNLEFRDKLSK